MASGSSVAISQHGVRPLTETRLVPKYRADGLSNTETAKHKFVSDLERQSPACGRDPGGHDASLAIDARDRATRICLLHGWFGYLRHIGLGRLGVTGRRPTTRHRDSTPNLGTDFHGGFLMDAGNTRGSPGRESLKELSKSSEKARIGPSLGHDRAPTTSSVPSPSTSRRGTSPKPWGMLCASDPESLRYAGGPGAARRAPGEQRPAHEGGLAGNIRRRSHAGAEHFGPAERLSGRPGRQPIYIVTVPKRGYRFNRAGITCTAVRRARPEAPPAALGHYDAGHAEGVPRGCRRGSLRLPRLVAISMGMGVFAGPEAVGPPSTPPLSPRSYLAVLAVRQLQRGSGG